MNTAVINIKTNPQIKARAQAVAEELGFSLSSLINGYLKHLVKTRAVHFTTAEKPTKYLLDALKESEKDIKSGRVSPGFDSAEDSIKWLNDPKARYINGDKV